MLAIAAVTLLAAAATGAVTATAPPERASLWVTAKDTGDRLASKEPVAFDPLPQPDEAFPTIIVASFAGFKDRPYFTATPGAEKPPAVKF